jgi:hypothetical protein
MMAIVIRRVDGLYEAEVTPPHGGGIAWQSPMPLTRDQMIQALRERGCHQTDIGDAFYDADPEWLLRE